MNKRPREADDTQLPPKRPRPEPNSRPAENVESARHLRQLLTFSQDGIQDLRHGINSFKAFLEQILYHADEDGHDDRKQLLRDYLDSEKPRPGDEIERPFLLQLWQAWSYANSNNNDHLASAVCAILALLLKTLSSSLDLADQGKTLCRTIMQHQHLRNIKRCLDAPKHKEFLLSPSLRLLNEVATFDGGVFIRELYKRREQSFDVLALRKCLAITKAQDPSDQESWRRPAVRTLAVRYILTHLKHQDEGAKVDILRQRPLCGAMFWYFKEDPPELVIEILRLIESHVFKDNDLPRLSKAAFLTEQHLHRVTELATRLEVNEKVQAEALRWLTAAATTPSYGILRLSGWYPPGTSRLDVSQGFDPYAMNLGLDNHENEPSAEEPPLRNPILAAWIKSLRPQVDTQERDLALACFKAAPELVHVYFSDMAVQMEPKLTNTWLGYASFMFEVVNLPVPPRLGFLEAKAYADLPPKISIVMESIMPKPWTSKVLTRCLTQSLDLIAFFAVRLLTISLQKVKSVYESSLEAQKTVDNPKIWQDFGKRFLGTVLALFPSAKDVANLYRRLPADEDHQLQREATAKLLRTYHETLPDAIAEEAFDISSVLVPVLSAQLSGSAESSAWRASERSHLLIVAQDSTTMRWFQKSGTLALSPLTTMLRLYCASPTDSSQIYSVAKSVLQGHGILEKAEPGHASAFEALISSLQDMIDEESVWELLDDLLVRVSKAPVKYLDQLDAISRSAKGEARPVSLLMAVVAEQVPFVSQKASAGKQLQLAWIDRLTIYMQRSPELGAVLKALSKQISQYIETSVQLPSAPLMLPEHERHESSDIEQGSADDATVADEDLPFALPPSEGTDHPELFRWQRKELESALEDNDVDGLLLCLSSEHSDVRKQASGQIDKFLLAVLASNLDEKEQIYLLIGELLETYKMASQSEEKPLPYLVSTFAVRALHVQTNPAHLMYAKLNQFLMKGPAWRTSSLSKYWLSATALSEPTSDGEYYSELQWVLDWLVDGLRTTSDVDLLRQGKSLERVMALYTIAGNAHKEIKSRVLEVVYRAATVDALTTVTRAGVLSWLDTLGNGLPTRLRSAILKKCDTLRLEAWSGVPVAVS